MAIDDNAQSAEVQRQLALEERARKIIARVRANRVFMAGVKEAAAARAKGERGTAFRDLKRKNAGR